MYDRIISFEEYVKVIDVKSLYDAGIPLILTKIENPKPTHIFRIMGKEVPVYNNYFTFPVKDYLIPVYNLFFEHEKWYEDVMHLKYMSYLNKLDYKAMPKIKKVTILSKSNTVDVFNMIVWGNLMTMTPKTVLSKAFKDAPTLNKMWNVVKDDYGHLMKLRGYTVYSLRHSIIKLIKVLEDSNRFNNTISNLITSTKRDISPVIRIPDYPLYFPMIPSEFIIKESSSLDFIKFENVTQIVEVLSHPDSSKTDEIKDFLKTNDKSYTTAIMLKNRLLFASVNPYFAEVKIFHDNMTTEIINKVTVKYYPQPVTIFKFAKEELWPGVKKSLHGGSVLSEYFYILKVNKYHYPVLTGNLITITDNGWIVLELYNNDLKNPKDKVIVTAPSELVKTVKIPVRGMFGRFKFQTYPAIQVGKMTILIDDRYTNTITYSAIGNFFNKIKKNK